MSYRFEAPRDGSVPVDEDVEDARAAVHVIAPNTLKPAHTSSLLTSRRCDGAVHVEGRRFDPYARQHLACRVSVHLSWDERIHLPVAPKERPVAVIAPTMRSIKLYADGRIDYRGKSGSVIGATARIDRSGEKHRLRDTRKVVLRIDGPRVAIAVPIPPASIQFNRYAETFVAQVNQISSKVSGTAPAPAVKPAPDPPRRIDDSMQVDGSVPVAAAAGGPDLQSMDVLIGQLERLGKLRDSGVLTEDEFQEQKAALLRAARNS